MIALGKGQELPGVVYKLLVILAACIWGLSFTILKDSVDNLTPAWLMAIRFLLAGIILGAFCSKRIASMKKNQVLKSCVCGLVLFGGYWVQTIGLTETTPGKNAFLTAVYCVIVPFVWWIVAKKKPTVFNICAAVICVMGIGCVSLGEDFSMGRGEAITLGCAVLYAVHIVLVAKWTDGIDAYALTAIQFLAGGMFGVVGALICEPLPTVLALSPDFLWNMVYLVIFATLIALLIQNVALSHVPPAQASLFLSLESVFGVLFSVLLYGEELTVRLVMGFALIFVGIMVSEIGPTLRQRRRGDIVEQ